MKKFALVLAFFLCAPLALFAMLSHSVTDHGRTLRATLPHLPFLQEPAKAIRILTKIGLASRAFRDVEV